MATTKLLMRDALILNDELPSDVVCIVRERNPYDDTFGPAKQCRFDELPEREFSDGYGGVEGDDVVGFTAHWVYVHAVYDGAEWFQAVPRDVETAMRMTRLPEVGGG